MALSGYLDHLNANPGDRLGAKGSTPDQIIAHAKSLGHDVSRAELDAHAHTPEALDAAGGGSCYFNGITACAI